MTSLVYERVHENLSKLGLDTMHSIMDNHLESEEIADKSFLEVLDGLLQEELQVRQARAVNTRTRLARFPFHKTLDDYDFSFQPSIDQKVINELRTLRFVHNCENVLLLGPPGVGKTHLAVALGVEAVRGGFSGYYTTAIEMVARLRQGLHRDTLDRRIRRYTRTKVLVIDEIGYLPLDVEGANLFFQVVARRYEKGATIFTSNKSFGEWGEVLGDPVLATAVLDRILHHCVVVSIKGESYRLKDRKRLGLDSGASKGVKRKS